MATELTVQSERAYQKQPHVFVHSKAKRAKSTKAGKGGRRWYKDVGLGFRTPKTAIEGTYIGILRLLKICVESYSFLQTRNAPSPAKSRSAVVSSQAQSSLQKCTARWSYVANTFTSSPSTPDTRNDTKTSQLMSHRRSVWKRVIR